MMKTRTALHLLPSTALVARDPFLEVDHADLELRTYAKLLCNRPPTGMGRTQTLRPNLSNSPKQLLTPPPCRDMRSANLQKGVAIHEAIERFFQNGLDLAD